MAMAKFKPFSNQNSLEKSKFEQCVVEQAVKELKCKMSLLKMRLLDCQNQNHALRKELLKAKKVVKTEVSPSVGENFIDNINQLGFRGRSEKILLLKGKLVELQNRIKEIEESDAAKEPGEVTKDEVTVKNVQNRKDVDNEVQYLLGNSCHLKRRTEIWKKRCAELSKEIEQLRLERDRLMEKSREDKIIHESYHEADKVLRERQSERNQMKYRLEAEKTKNISLAEELEGLKENLSLILSKVNDDKLLIEALQNQQGYLHDLLERQKMISDNDNRRFQDDLIGMQEKHITNSHVLDHLRGIVEEKSQKCEELQNSMKPKEPVEHKDGKESTVTMTTDSTLTEHTESSHPSSLEPPPTETSSPASEQPTDAEVVPPQPELEAEIAKLTEEYEQYQHTYPSINGEIEHLKVNMVSNKDKINNWMSQLFQTRSLMCQTNAEIRDLEETVRILRKSSSSIDEVVTRPKGASFAEEMHKTEKVLNLEYNFLVIMWRQLFSTKDNLLDIFNLSTECMRKQFNETTENLISSIDVPKVDLDLPPQAETEALPQESLPQ